MDNKSIKDKEAMLQCSHCGKFSTHVIVWSGNGPKEKVEDKYIFQIYYYLVQCKSCEDVSLYTDWEASDDPGNLTEAFLLYPKQKEISTDVPLSIGKNYDEAKKIKKISPIAFAVLIRRCLEYVCRDKEANGRSLKDQIEDLVQKGIIPSTLSNMVDILRHLGNIGAHANDFSISEEEADILDDFFVAVIEYVYIAPKKIAIVTEKIKSKTK